MGGWVGGYAVVFVPVSCFFAALSVIYHPSKYVSDERTCVLLQVIASAFFYNAALAFGHLDAAPGLLQKTFECWFKEIDDHGAEWPHLPVTK